VRADGRPLIAQALSRGSIPSAEQVFDVAAQLDAIAPKGSRALGDMASSFHRPSLNDPSDLESDAEMFCQRFHGSCVHSRKIEPSAFGDDGWPLNKPTSLAISISIEA
jgi:hypothetical protein